MAFENVSEPPVDVMWLGKQLSVLAEPQRLRILHMLMEGIQCNCDLGEALDMAPNLISHHLRTLRQAGLVNVERDVADTRWVYYSPNREALEKLTQYFGLFFDPSRIKPRRHTCGPKRKITEKEEQKNNQKYP